MILAVSGDIAGIPKVVPNERAIVQAIRNLGYAPGVGHRLVLSGKKGHEIWKSIVAHLVVAPQLDPASLLEVVPRAGHGPMEVQSRHAVYSEHEDAELFTLSSLACASRRRTIINSSKFRRVQAIPYPLRIENRVDVLVHQAVRRLGYLDLALDLALGRLVRLRGLAGDQEGLDALVEGDLVLELLAVADTLEETSLD